jgi:hypothetical protein
VLSGTDDDDLVLRHEADLRRISANLDYTLAMAAADVGWGRDEKALAPVRNGSLLRARRISITLPDRAVAVGSAAMEAARGQAGKGRRLNGTGLGAEWLDLLTGVSRRGQGGVAPLAAGGGLGYDRIALRAADEVLRREDPAVEIRCQADDLVGLEPAEAAGPQVGGAAQSNTVCILGDDESLVAERAG